ncbi:MAG: hypothetical protein C0476_01490 [Sphingomonas sp.]|nr:hypothetical protein [Sphingomonas sp.]
MTLFEAIVALHVVAGTTGLIAFWVPVATRKGGAAHRRYGSIGARALMIAGALAIAMALLSLYGPEQRLPMIKDRALFAGLFGWMMLYLGLLTIGFADYGLAVARYRSSRRALRGVRHQGVFAAVMASALRCGATGWALGQPLMMLVAAIGMIALATQLYYIWAPTVAPRGYVQQHFRALLGMGISAYTAFLSVGLIRLVPDHVFNPLIWAVPSIVGVTLIIVFTLRTAPPRKVSAAPGR